MPWLRVTREQAQWDDRLKREGLGLIEQRVSGNVVLRTQIITPRPQYIPNPQELRDALKAWLDGDRTRFNDAGHEMLRRNVNQHSPRRRARILVLVCEGLIDGQSINEAAGDRSDVAYRYLRPLAARLAEENAPVDDDHTGDDGTSALDE